MSKKDKERSKIRVLKKVLTFDEGKMFNVLKNYSNRVVGKTKITVSILPEEYYKYLNNQEARLEIVCKSKFETRRNPQQIFAAKIEVNRKEVEKKERELAEPWMESGGIEGMPFRDLNHLFPSKLRLYLREILNSTLPKMEKEFNSTVKQKVVSN